MGEVYWAQYRFDEQWQIVKEPCLSAPEQVITEGASCAAGNGLAAYADRFTGLAPVGRWPELMPHASQIAQLGRQFALQGQGVHAREAQPLYLRNKVALTTAERSERTERTAGAGA
jgi:tRNA threonylcarbamoyladenosine biosynthesis protein TsaB